MNLAQTQVNSADQTQTCQQSLGSIFTATVDPVNQFSKWLTYCKSLEIRVPSKSFEN
jgi:hypothetical protein